MKNAIVVSDVAVRAAEAALAAVAEKFAALGAYEKGRLEDYFVRSDIAAKLADRGGCERPTPEEAHAALAALRNWRGHAVPRQLMAAVLMHSTQNAPLGDLLFGIHIDASHLAM